MIRLKNTSDTPEATIDSRCRWNKTFTKTPDDLECIISYCDNATDAPNTPHNYNFVWDNNVIPINTAVDYPCRANHAVEQQVNWKQDADTSTSVQCLADGTLQYPDPWPQCSTSITCADPGNSAEITRTYMTPTVDFLYGSKFKYVCDDLRKWIKLRSESNAQLLAEKESNCLWKKAYEVDGTDLVCVMHHCRHPHDEPGKHDPPPSENQINLVNRDNWNVPFGVSIVYECAPNTFIENTNDDPLERTLDVECIADQGVYNTPVRQGELWPNCTETVICGQPPDPDVNVTRTWISASEGQMTYNTHVKYECQWGSQFDTDNDGVGDSPTVTIRCLWNKNWSPFQTIPPCIVTHCVEPFTIPEDTNLEELTSDPTPINTKKQYRCKNQLGNVPRMFWESDRSKSTFELHCYPDGYFVWQEWPICLTDIECSPLPPVIPTHEEYFVSAADGNIYWNDGSVTINSLEYPTYPTEARTTNLVNYSNFSNTLIPKNYMANLTYHCGTGREFKLPDESHTPTESMTCQWDKTWTPTSTINTCDWVACLKPPIPPASTNLRITDWFGDTIPFGQQIRFVCERGYFFEVDPTQIDVKYTCQDGSKDEYKDKRGFFDVPEKEEDWPRCLLGMMYVITSTV